MPVVLSVVAAKIGAKDFSTWKKGTETTCSGLDFASIPKLRQNLYDESKLTDEQPTGLASLGDKEERREPSRSTMALLTDVPAEVFHSVFSEAIGPQRSLQLHNKGTDSRLRLAQRKELQGSAAPPCSAKSS